MREWLVEVGFRKSSMDAKSNLLLGDLHELGFRHVGFVRSSFLYKIKGEFTRQQMEDICLKLLVDPITQIYTVPLQPVNGSTLLGPPSVEVWPKPGTTDVVGDSVRQAIKDLGFSSVDAVRTGQKFHFSGRLNHQELEGIAKGLLANTLVQDYIIHDDNTAVKH